MHVYNNIYAILLNILLLCESNEMPLEEQIHAKGKINLARYAVSKCPKQTRKGSEGKLFSVYFSLPDNIMKCLEYQKVHFKTEE